MNNAIVQSAFSALMADPEVPTGVRPALLGGEALVIRERTDAEPIVLAVMDAVRREALDVTVTLNGVEYIEADWLRQALGSEEPS